MLPGEAELAREVASHDVAVEQGRGTLAVLDELAVHDARQRRLARAREAREEQGDAHAVSRRVDLSQLVEDFREREPCRNVLATRKPPGEGVVAKGFRRLVGVVRFGRVHEARAPGRVRQPTERHHADADLRLLLCQPFLGRVRRIKAPVALVGRAAVIGPDNEMAAAAVAPDDGVPRGLARPRHACRQRQQRKRRQPVWIVPAESLIALDAREATEVAGPADADDRMQQDIRFRLLGRCQRDVVLETMHGRCGVKCHHPPPAQLLEKVTKILRGMPQIFVIVMRRQLDALDPAAHVHGLHLLVQVRHAGMGGVAGAVDALCLRVSIRRPDIVHREHRQHESLAVAQRQAVAGSEALCETLRHVEGYRYRPHAAVGQARIIEHARVAARVHEARERRERTAHEQLEIAELALRERDGGQIQRGALERLCTCVVDHERLQRRWILIVLVGQSRVPGRAFVPTFSLAGRPYVDRRVTL